MKAIITTLAGICAIAFSSSAQVSSGTVHYRETISFNVALDGEAAQFASMLPKEQKLEHLLYFNADASMFKPVAPEKEPEDAPEKTEGIHIRMDVPQERYYTSLKDAQTVALREFYGRKFLVTGPVQKQSWKMTGQQKTILNYPCQEALLYRDHDTVSAWFTTSIPVSAGPRGLSGLPGLILATKEGSHSEMIATAIEPDAVPAGVIAAPKGGRKVTDEQFKTIVEEKMTEMGATRGAGGEQVIIKVRHN